MFDGCAPAAYATRMEIAGFIFNVTLEGAAFVVSLVAISLTIWEGIATRRHNRLSVRPYIISRKTRDWSPKGMRYRYVLSNTGLGPAIVRELSLTVKGEKVTGEDPAAEVVKRCCGAAGLKYEVNSSSEPSPGYCLKPGEDYLLAEVFFPGLLREKEEELAKTLDPTGIRFVVESMYGEQSVFTGVEEKPVNKKAATPAMTVTHPSVGK